MGPPFLFVLKVYDRAHQRRLANDEIKSMSHHHLSMYEKFTTVIYK